MTNSPALFWYGVTVIVVSLGFIVIPFLRGKSDLVTGWNTLLLGLAIYVGCGCIDVNYTRIAWEHLQWFQPSSKEVSWYILATTAFIATLLVSYYYNLPAKSFAQRRLRKWPPFTAPLTFFVLVFCLIVVVASMFTGRITFIGPALSNMSHKAAVFACTFSFLLWYKNRLNVMWLALFVGVFLVAALFSMVVFSGRRLLLSVFLGPILCVYWVHARNWRPSRTLATMGMAAAFILAVSAIYSTFRWFNVATKEQRTTSAIIEQLRSLRSRDDLFGFLLGNRLTYLAQANAHYSLLTQRFVNDGRLQPRPLNTLRFLASYPVPRRMWRHKPDVIGVAITRDYAGVPTTNWGIGIPGHGAYEGGILALMLYAMLLSIGARWMDEPLRLQPDNPFLISLHAAALPHIVAIPRGDLGIMVTETAECFLFAILLGIVCRMLFGTQRTAVSGNVAANPWRYQAFGRRQFRAN